MVVLSSASSSRTLIPNAGKHSMATRDYRLAEFSQALPPTKKLLQVLAEDNSGTYVLPFFCEWRDGGWHNPKSAKPLEAEIVGWRKAPRVR
jgi:hypothetical protein